MTKPKKIFSLFICVFLLSSVIFSLIYLYFNFNKPFVPADNGSPNYFDNFNPVLRFSVASDVHIDDSDSDLEEQRLAKLFDVCYDFAENSTTSYKGFDLALFAGDITNRGTETALTKFNNILIRKIKPQTKPFISMGNHDFFAYDNDVCIENFENILNTKQDEHIKVKGFHFIKLSSLSNYYTEEKVEWLENELKIANADTPNKPIFVMQHHPQKDTVYGSSIWSVEYFDEVFKKYPQVVNFAGHSHYPIIDDRSLWQKDYTVINTGTLSYCEIGVNGYANSHQFPVGKDGAFQFSSTGERDLAQFHIVEVDSFGAIKLTGYDLISDTILFERFIQTPADKTSFKTNEQKAAESIVPNFPTYALLSINEISNDGFVVNIPQLITTTNIESYRVYVYENDTLVSTNFALSGYIFRPIPQVIKCKVTDLNSKTKYLIKVYAVNCYNVLNEVPLTLEVTTF